MQSKAYLLDTPLEARYLLLRAVAKKRVLIIRGRYDRTSANKQWLLDACPFAVGPKCRPLRIRGQGLLQNEQRNMGCASDKFVIGRLCSLKVLAARKRFDSSVMGEEDGRH